MYAAKHLLIVIPLLEKVYVNDSINNSEQLGKPIEVVDIKVSQWKNRNCLVKGNWVLGIEEILYNFGQRQVR